MNLEVRQATPQHRAALESMLHRYLRELATLEGRPALEEYQYPYLPLYWREAARFPFLIMLDSHIAGFALVRRIDDEGGRHYQMAEFFVEPAQRRKGVGQRAAVEIFCRFPGRWRVHQQTFNHRAREFWRTVISEYAPRGFQETEFEDGPRQEFISRPASRDQGVGRAEGDGPADPTP